MAEQNPKSTTTSEHAPTSNADLMASAKIVAEAAQSSFGKDGKPVDKAKVAGAAEDILEAAEKYGKLDESSGVGQYVNKAEDYLHKLHSSESTTTASPPANAGSEGEKKEEVKKSSDEGGASDVINMAKKGLGGFFS